MLQKYEIVYFIVDILKTNYYNKPCKGSSPQIKNFGGFNYGKQKRIVNEAI
jgi:hypothetical protein